MTIQWFSNLNMNQNHPEGLQVTGHHPRLSDSMGLRWSLRFGISKRFTGDFDVSPTLRTSVGCSTRKWSPVPL